MPDITMCGGAGCPRAKSCYRAQATPSDYRQSWFSLVPVTEQGECNHYWAIEECRQVKEELREDYRS